MFKVHVKDVLLLAVNPQLCEINQSEGKNAVDFITITSIRVHNYAASEKM